MFQREPEVRGVERDGASDVLHLVSHAVDAHDERAWLSLARSCASEAWSRSPQYWFGFASVDERAPSNVTQQVRGRVLRQS